jgi:Na+-transporting NADH:ubiquinone oxidoreductase subunit C
VNNESPQKALLVVFSIALVCSILVSVAAVSLRPIQIRNQLVEKSRNIVALSGLVDPGEDLSSDEILIAVTQLDSRIIDIDTGEFEGSLDANEFDPRAAVNDPELGTAIPDEEDSANLGRRSRYEIVHLVWEGDELKRIILPIVGQGMWSTLYGFIALEADLNTIAAISFYEQAETAGLGDQITHASWQSRWQGRELFGSDGSFRFRIATGPVDDGSVAARHQVDAMTGATITGTAVTRMVSYWFGPHGYRTFLNNLKNNPPVRPVTPQGQD